MSRRDARDPALPFLEVVLTPNRMEQFLNERVLPSLFPGETATRVRRRSLHYAPGQRAVALYSLQSASNGRPLPQRAVVSAFADGRSVPLPPNHYAAAGTHGVFLTDENVLVEFFPLDWRLPGLPVTADPDQMSATLARMSGSAAGTWRCAVAQYRPNERCVVVWENAETQHKVVAKLYAHATRAARAHTTLETLSRTTTRAASVRTPRPLSLVAEHAAMWMEHAEGVPLTDLLPTDPGSALDEDALSAAARGLAELHALPAQTLRAPDRTLSSERARIRRRSRHVAILDREVACGLDWFLEALEEDRGGAAPAPRSALLHGNTRPDQLWLRDGRLVLLDLDGVAHGDPALDLGSFLASLAELQLDSRRSEPLARTGERLLEAYGKHVRGDPDLPRRARRAAAQELVGRAAQSFLERAGERDVPPDATRCHLLLDQASRLLHGS